ncbi:MAG: tetratricopeptide repeat protein [Acidobacteriota bacterium]|nr:tetratricopeptide repeat protein [Acidobacteriota bacterium]
MTNYRTRFLFAIALPGLLALLFVAQNAAGQNSSIPQQTQPAAMITTASTAPLAPAPSEMRAMTPGQLDELGDRLRAAKDYNGALDCYHAAIRKQPDAAFYNKVAISEIMLRHAGAAQKAARKAVRKDRNMAEAWNNLGVAFYLDNRLEAAIHNYEKAIQLTPERAPFHNNLAAALMDHKEFEKGVEEYRKAFALDPEFFEHSAANGISARLGSPRDRAQFDFVLARLFAATGDFPHTLHFLKAAMENGYPRIDDVYKDKEFAALLNDERFTTLMKERPAAIR